MLLQDISAAILLAAPRDRAHQAFGVRRDPRGARVRLVRPLGRGERGRLRTRRARGQPRLAPGRCG